TGSIRALRARLEPPLRPWSLEWFSLGRVAGRARLGAGGHCSRQAGGGLVVVEAVPPALAVASRSLRGSCCLRSRPRNSRRADSAVRAGRATRRGTAGR